MSEHKQTESDFFDNISQKNRLVSFYQEFFELDFGRPFKEYFYELLGDLSGQKILEYGCGNYGDLFKELTARNPKEIVSVDISFDSLVNTRTIVEKQANHQSVKLSRCDCERLPFSSGQFDLIVGRAILHHLNLSNAIPEIRRILKPEGRAIFIEPLGTNPLISLYRALTPGCRTPDEHPLTMNDIKAFNRYFSKVTHQEFNLFTLPVLLLARFYKKKNTLDRVLSQAQDFEKKIFSYIPGLQQYSWTTVIELS